MPLRQKQGPLPARGAQAKTHTGQVLGGATNLALDFLSLVSYFFSAFPGITE